MKYSKLAIMAVILFVIGWVIFQNMTTRVDFFLFMAEFNNISIITLLIFTLLIGFLSTPLLFLFKLLKMKRSITHLNDLEKKSLLQEKDIQLLQHEKKDIENKLKRLNELITDEKNTISIELLRKEILKG